MISKLKKNEEVKKYLLKNHIKVYLAALLEFDGKVTDIEELRNLFTYDNYTIYVHEYLYPWLDGLRREGRLEEDEDYYHKGEFLDGSPCGRTSYGYTVVKGAIEGVHREGNMVCEYRDGQPFGKATEDTRDESGYGELHNIIYEHGYE